MRAEVVKAVKNNMLSHVIAAVNRNITLDSFSLVYYNEILQY
jgi:hypothetical protein